MATVRRVAVAAPMASELEAVAGAFGLARDPAARDDRRSGRLGGVEVVAVPTGIGTALAADAARRLLDADAPDLVLVVGIAGGLASAVAVGDVVVPALVEDAAGGVHRPAPVAPPGAGLPPPHGILRTSDEFTVDPGRLAALAARGVVALDMETAAVAAVCERAGTPWAVVRAISDLADDHPLGAAALHLVKPDGRPDPAAVARYVARHPARVPALARLGRDAARAATAAATAAAAAVRALAVGRTVT
ncbi:MAG: hypothetical protein KatS3mg009_2959 [Acidimicrobiia bacterium]|nr:MAG: hypothetical protein KatS3mg009_2959 [Acidimicrobiia bacterium]